MKFNYKRSIYIFILLCLLFLSTRELVYGFIAYSQSTWVVQWFGNFYDSQISIKDKRIIGKDSCNTEQINLFISDDIINVHNDIVDSLWNKKLSMLNLKTQALNSLSLS